MIALAHQVPTQEPRHATFLSMLPRIVNFARVTLRGFDPEAREDALAEVVANCFVAYARLIELGKEDMAYPTVLAMYAIRQYRDGRRVGTKANSSDAYTRRPGVRVERLGTPYDHRWQEQLVDNTRSPVPDQVAFRIDFPAWLETLTERDREAALQLVDGERTRGVARKIGVSKGRVSQIRRELQEGWNRFHGEVGA